MAKIVRLLRFGYSQNFLVHCFRSIFTCIILICPLENVLDQLKITLFLGVELYHNDFIHGKQMKWMCYIDMLCLHLSELVFVLLITLQYKQTESEDCSAHCLSVYFMILKFSSIWYSCKILKWFGRHVRLRE